MLGLNLLTVAATSCIILLKNRRDAARWPAVGAAVWAADMTLCGGCEMVVESKVHRLWVRDKVFATLR